MSQCLAIANEVGDRAGEGRAYGNLGIAYQSKGDFSKDIQYHAQDLAIAKEVGDRAEEGAAYANLGIAYKLQGDFSKAIEYHTQRLAVAKEVGDRAGEGRAYGIMQRRWATAYGIIAKEVGDRASGRGRAGRTRSFRRCGQSSPRSRAPLFVGSCDSRLPLECLCASAW
jgi:tetratricopeptide (TPR) repeat protein